MTWLVVGASSGLGRALAERLAQDGRELLLVSSDARDLGALAADLRITRGVAARCLALDAADHELLAARLGEAVPPGETVEGLLFPIGMVDDQDDGRLAAARGAELVAVNFLAVASVLSVFLPRLLSQGRGVVLGFSSVAAVRGRSRNVVYAAAKRALESCLDSVRHLAEPHGVCVGYYVLGYLDTNLAWGRPLPLGPADPRRLAERVCRELGRCRGRRYHPRLWAAVSFLLRALPWTVFRRMRF